MQLSASILALSFAAAAVSAASIESRASSITCYPAYNTTGFLGFTNNDDEGEVFNISTKAGIKKNGNTVLTSLLGPKKAPVDGQTWMFTPCDSTYMAFANFPVADFTNRLAAPAEEINSLQFGLLSLESSTKRCLQTSSGSVKTADQVLVNGICSSAEDKKLIQQYVIYDSDNNAIYFNQGRYQKNQYPTGFVLSSSNSKALKLVNQQNENYLTLAQPVVAEDDGEEEVQVIQA